MNTIVHYVKNVIIVVTAINVRTNCLRARFELFMCNKYTDNASIVM